MLDNHNFSGQFDICPYIELDVNNKCRWANVMLANIAWNHCDAIAMSHTDTHRAMYCPIILGSDKTTVSVTMGHVEYHPLNTNSLSGYPEVPVIRQCPDGHYWWVIYDLMAFIADYPEQVMLMGIVQGWCPKCTASPNNPLAASGPRTGALTDQLVQLLDLKTLWDQYGINNDIIVIKGAFKDHLVTWVCSYLRLIHSESQGDAIIDDIDRQCTTESSRQYQAYILSSIAIIPPFPGLRCFPHGCHFKQWMGDDSKALMKVYLPAIVGYVPDDMVLYISAFLDTCYIACRQHLDKDSLKTFDTSFSKYLQLREVFCTTGI
ncbi:hypothetical protein BGW80DRAFT_1261011 [Lactifluus volemus]|nr:hypothetical protein BGW80DRAFT_1261011 [Lactifluus volemus]